MSYDDLVFSFENEQELEALGVFGNEEGEEGFIAETPSTELALINDVQVSLTSNDDASLYLEEIEDALQSLKISQAIYTFRAAPLIEFPNSSSFTSIDLRTLAVSVSTATYDPRRSPAKATISLSPELMGGADITVTAFDSAVFTVFSNEPAELVQRAAHFVVKLLNKIGAFVPLGPKEEFFLVGEKKSPSLSYKVVYFECKKINVTLDCGFPVRLEDLFEKYQKYCSYLPDTFCGAVFRYHTEIAKAVILIYVSGKLTITGCSDLKTSRAVFKDIYVLLHQFKH